MCRRRPDDGGPAGSHLGVVQPELARRRRPGVPLGPRGVDAPACSRQLGDRVVQWRRIEGFATQSGGYAGAKATVRFITSYAAGESERNGLGIEFVSVLPQLTPETDLGLAAVQAYAGRQGVDVDAFVHSMAPVLTSEHVGKTVLDIATGRLRGHHAYALASAGASALD